MTLRDDRTPFDDGVGAAPLDNPVWASLTTLHAPLALRSPRGAVARYPADVAPFLAVEQDGARVDDALAELVPVGDSVLCVGPRPAVPAGWRLEDFGVILQMVRADGIARGADVDGEVVEIDAGRRRDVIELAALVYPHYFRARTPEMGRYFGIYRGGVLAAMAGERMGWPGTREISAVCTRPELVGQGFARRLMAHLVGDLTRAGVSAMLHVSPTNTRARALYEGTGWRVRREISFCALHR